LLHQPVAYRIGINGSTATPIVESTCPPNEQSGNGHKIDFSKPITYGVEDQ